MVAGRRSVGKSGKPGRGDAMPGHELLGEHLAPFQTRRRGRRTEDLEPLFDEAIHDARHQRRLRAHNGEVHPVFLGKGAERFNIRRRNGHALAKSLHAAVARGAVNFFR